MRCFDLIQELQLLFLGVLSFYSNSIVSSGLGETLSTKKLVISGNARFNGRHKLLSFNEDYHNLKLGDSSRSVCLKSPSPHNHALFRRFGHDPKERPEQLSPFR